MDRRVGRAVVFAFAGSIAVAGVVWGSIYAALGAPGAAVYPYAFSTSTLVNALVYRRTGRFVPFAWIQVLLILMVPFLLALHLGGFAASGGIPIWSSLAPIGAMLFLGRREALAMLGAFLAVSVLTVWPDAIALPAGSIPPLARDVFLVLNLIAVTTVVLASVRTFVATYAALQEQQRKLRELERAYVSQEALLRQQERLATLGKLSAGVAHELNNPAAAAGRGSQQLEEILARLAAGAQQLLGMEGDPRCLSSVQTAAAATPVGDALDRSDRIDDLQEWLRSLGAADAWELAEALVDAGLDRTSAEQAARSYPPAQVLVALRWRADTDRARRLTGDIRSSSRRIGEIVAALKGYTHMDRAARQEVDVVRGLEDTLVILRSQLSGVEVRREFDDGLPRIVANAGELNQVWTNLLANAAEAMAGRGTLILRVKREGKGVRVEVEDDGPGIDPELVDRVFDPFVTSKAPGEGTGLGLHLVHRTITDGHGGSITVTSQPGRTCFAATLPPGGDGG